MVSTKVQKIVQPKIALCMILKHDEPEDRLGRCLSSILPHVDIFYATITTADGKPDTKCSVYKVLQKIDKKKYPMEISWFKWIGDFAAARNYNLKQVKSQYEYVFWCDADDIVLGGQNLRQLAQLGTQQDIGAFFCTYYYLLSKPGLEHFAKTGQIQEEQVLIKHLRERLIKKDLYKWIGMLHETLIEQTATKKTDVQSFAIVHTAEDKDLEEALERNIKILENALKIETKEKRRDPRTVYYLGKAYFDKHDEKLRLLSKTLLNEYLETSGWEEERAQAWQYLSTICLEEENSKEALRSAVGGLLETPIFPANWLQVANCYARRGEWEKAKFWAEIAGSIPQPRTTLILNTRGETMNYMELLFGHAVETNNLDASYALAKRMIDLAPEHEAAKSRFGMITNLKIQNDTLLAYRQLASYLNKKGEVDKIIPLLAAVPTDLANNKLVEDVRRLVLPPRVWKDDEIAFYCGPGFEKWSPKNMKEWKRLAGSEEATVRLCRELAKLGWKVTVFAEPQDDEGTYDGVTYLPHYKFNFKDSFNILLFWRRPELLDRGFKAKKTYLWLHDIPNPLDYTKERVEVAEKIIPLSRWHRERLPDVPNEKFMISANGIDLSQFNKKDIKRDPYRCIYTSSYDRGIEHLLKMWPDIKKAVPQATLHIFYGWGLFDKFYYNNPERLAWKEKIVKLMEQPGVKEYGKVDQDRIVEEYYKSGIWAYPTHFGEISCITAMKCQAAGAIPVVIDYAALKETVQWGAKVEGDIYDDETKENYKRTLISMLKNHQGQEEIREKMIPWAKKEFGWAKVAQQWSDEFKQSGKTK